MIYVVILCPQENNPFLGGVTLDSASRGGDSATSEQKTRVEEFKAKLTGLADGEFDREKGFVVVMDDPTGNSYLQVKILSDFLTLFSALCFIKCLNRLCLLDLTTLIIVLILQISLIL